MSFSRRHFIRSTLAVTAGMTLCSTKAFSAEHGWIERVRPLMGAPFSIAVFGAQADSLSLIERCFEYCQEITRQITNWERDSTTSEFNERRMLLNPPGHYRRLINAAMYVSNVSRGLFLPTCHDLTLLWRNARREGVAPSPLDIRYSRARSSSSRIIHKDNLLTMEGAGSFDVNGIGQGFVAEAAVSFLREHGVRFARVDASGDIQFLGPTRWKIDVENPRADRILGSFSVDGDIAVGTSGDYREFWYVNGKRYHHLIDPRTGLPGEANAEVVVTHPSATVADALATALFFLPAVEALRLVATIPTMEVLLVSPKGEISVSRGLAPTWS